MDATQIQALLTLTFNFVCISYATLAGANFVLGLMEQWTVLAKGNSISGVEATNDVGEESEANDLEEEQQIVPPIQEDIELEQLIQDWLVVEPATDWHGWNCPLQVTTKYWNKADELLSKSIRELKAMCKGRVKNYSSLTKAQLVEALLST
jgi:hypothetical protein